MSHVELIKSLVHITANSNPGNFPVLQEKRFRKILHHAYHASPFYKKHYNAQGIREKHLANIPIHELPVVNKNIIMENFDSVICSNELNRQDVDLFIGNERNVGEKFKNKYSVIHTSGSSGTVGFFVYGSKDWALLKALVLKRVSKAKLNPFQKIRLAFFGATEGNYAGISLAREAPSLFYDFRSFSVNDSLNSVVDQLNEFQPDFINGYSSGVNILANEQLYGSLRIKPRKIFGSGDELSENTRGNIKKAFGIDPANLYGTSESVGLGVRESGKVYMELFYEWHIFEAMRGGVTAQPGETGSLILTNLYNYTQPLIRYELNDEVIVHKNVEKPGTGVAEVRSIAGRKEESITFEDNNGGERTLHPIMLSAFFVSGLEKFQYFQKRNNTLLMKVKVRGDEERIKEDIENKMKDIFEMNNINQKIRLQIEIVPDIKNDIRTGKFKLINILSGD